MATAASNVGTWAQSVALAIVVYDATGSVAKVAAINLARYVGSLVLGPISGSLTDRRDGAWVLCAAQLGAGAFTFMLFLDFSMTGSSIARITAIAVGIGLFDAASGPAMQAILPRLVDHTQLGVAIALNSTSFNLARVVGPLAGAVMLAVGGPSTVFALNTVSYAAAGVVAYTLVTRGRRAAAARAEWQLRAMLRTPGLVPLLAVTATVSLAIEPVSTLTPAVAAEGLGFETDFAAVLVGLFGGGAVMAVLARGGRTAPTSRAMALALAAIPLGMAPMWLDLGTVAVALGLLLSGAGFLEAQSLSMTRLHLLATDRLRGRVMALWSVCYLGTRPFASVLTGLTADRLGYRAAGFLVGVPAVVGALLLLRWERGGELPVSGTPEDPLR